ncbi:MAG: hypothetical protein JEZ09_18115 [Salinivirgaceae bacterium]|nr:hypothetical protein [Salinivirgaceae bacterium]
MRPLIVAHRGESFIAPENTLAAINLAWANKVTAVEIDVQLTLDNQIVVIHDYNTQRLGNINLVVKKSKLHDLKAIDVGSFKCAAYAGEQIPTLHEVLKTVPSNGKLIIEIKCGIEIIPYLVDEITNSALASHQIEIISFNYQVLSKIRSLVPKHKLLWLLKLNYYFPSCLSGINKRRIANKISKAQLDGINVWAGKTINKKFVNYFKDKKLLVYTWTTNDLSTAQKLSKLNVDAITTDRAAWLIDKMQKSN